MTTNESRFYAAFKAKDARFDGRIFIGISTTGIYCRPVCKARQPRSEHCTYYRSAAEAEQAGYRPCLLCRPELAPGHALVDPAANLVHRAARSLEENCGSGLSLKDLAGRLGYSDRHLRRVFMAEYHVSPVQYIQTCRLLLAKNLLTDTNLSVLDVAMAAGFGSLRSINHLFKKQYHLTPSALRKNSTLEKKQGNFTIGSGFRPPYLWDEMINFLAARAIRGVEVVKDNAYLRTVCLEKKDGTSVSGWLRVGFMPEKNTLAVTVSETLLPELPQVLARVRHLFDLYCDPDEVYETLQAMNSIRPGLCKLGTRVPGSFDAFEMAVRAVLGQQITVKAAGTLAARIVERYGTPLQTGIEGLNRIFPSPATIVAMGDGITDHFGELGVTSARTRTISEIARAIVQKEIDFDTWVKPEEEINKLLKIRGIGSWTAQYIAMRAMAWPDAFLETDYGVRKALQPRTAKEAFEMAEAWRPWRSYAVVNLWNSL